MSRLRFKFVSDPMDATDGIRLTDCWTGQFKDRIGKWLSAIAYVMFPDETKDCVVICGYVVCYGRLNVSIVEAVLGSLQLNVSTVPCFMKPVTWLNAEAQGKDVMRIGSFPMLSEVVLPQRIQDRQKDKCNYMKLIREFLVSKTKGCERIKSLDVGPEVDV